MLRLRIDVDLGLSFQNQIELLSKLLLSEDEIALFEFLKLNELAKSEELLLVLNFLKKLH